jgi:hypothetical protein
MLDSLAKIEGLPAQTLLFGHGDAWMQGVESAVRRARETGPT